MSGQHRDFRLQIRSILDDSGLFVRKNHVPTKTHNLTHSVFPMEKKAEITKRGTKIRKRCVFPLPLRHRGGRIGMSPSPSWETWSDVVHIVSCCWIRQKMKNKVGSKTKKSPGRQPNTASSIVFFHLNKWLTESIDQAPVWLKRGKTKERTSFLLTHRLWEAVLNLRRWINKGSKTAAVVDPRSLKCLQTGWFLLTWWWGMLPKTNRHTCSRAWHWVSQLLLGYPQAMMGSFWVKIMLGQREQFQATKTSTTTGSVAKNNYQAGSAAPTASQQGDWTMHYGAHKRPFLFMLSACLNEIGLYVRPHLQSDFCTHWSDSAGVVCERYRSKQRVLWRPLWDFCRH